MADGIGFRVISAEFRRDMLAIDRRTERATMWGLREVSRRLRREAKRRTPVYKGAGSSAMLKKGAMGPQSGGPVTGLLKASISGSKRLQKRGPGDYSLKSGPRGARAHLYAAKVEARAHFMQGAYDATMPEVDALMTKAWERAMRGRV